MLTPAFAVRICLIGVMVLGATLTCGQDYPSKPIRIITAAAGGGSDFVSRVIATGISGSLGQPVVIDNRTSGLVPNEAVFRSPPDGYTLLVNGGVVWISPLLQKVPYDVLTDFAPVSLITKEIFILAVHPSVPVHSLKELIALAKTRPGELNHAAGEVGGSAYFAWEMFKSLAGVKIVHVPYKAASQRITATMSGEVQLVILEGGLLVPHVKSGRLRALAITSAEPSPLAPSLPTVAAAGVPGYEMVGRTGVFAPGKTPTPIVNRLNQEIVRVISTPEVKERFLVAWLEPVGSSPEQFAATMKSDIVRLGKVVKDAGISP